MSSVMYERMRVNPKFQKLVQRAGTLRLDPVGHCAGPFLRLLHAGRLQPGAAGAEDRRGIDVADRLHHRLCMFVFFWLLTVVYVRRANGEFDDLTADLIKDAQKEKL
jgi:uncharacterized membrane protein (DUF485 family)